MLAGPVTTTADGRIQVATQGAGTVTAARDSSEVIRSKEEQAVYQTEIDRFRNPRLVDPMDRLVGFGLFGKPRQR